MKKRRKGDARVEENVSLRKKRERKSCFKKRMNVRESKSQKVFEYPRWKVRMTEREYVCMCEW